MTAFTLCYWLIFHLPPKAAYHVARFYGLNVQYVRVLPVWGTTSTTVTINRVDTRVTMLYAGRSYLGRWTLTNSTTVTYEGVTAADVLIFVPKEAK